MTHWLLHSINGHSQWQSKVTDCSKRLAGKEMEVWWRWAKRLCKYESEWLRVLKLARLRSVPDGQQVPGRHTVYEGWQRG